jgi:hypothetical protein
MQDRIEFSRELANRLTGHGIQLAYASEYLETSEFFFFEISKHPAIASDNVG